jgi:hypothetical protein
MPAVDGIALRREEPADRRIVERMVRERAPRTQRQGVGSTLITHTLDQARRLGFRAVLLFGNPAYYSRFGFADATRFGITTHDGYNFPAFMALPMRDGPLNGVAGKIIDDPIFTTLDPKEAETFNRDLDEHVPTPPVANGDELGLWPGGGRRP